LSYKEKYLKYKTKYLNLQSQIGGGGEDPTLYNKLGQVNFTGSISTIYIDWNKNPKSKKTNIPALLIFLLNNEKLLDDDGGYTQLSFSPLRRSLARGDEIGFNTDWINKFFAEVQANEIIFEKITKIHLYANLGEEDSIKKIENIFNLSIFPNLKTLVLRKCNIGDTQINEIAEILKKFLTLTHPLTHLWLDHNNITNEGAKNIAPLLKKEGLTIYLQCQRWNEELGNYEVITKSTVELFSPTKVIIDTDMCRNEEIEAGE